ncbi:MAG: SDR family NAD(P)-dependent oxidoreductase [Novosphingobium sp.]
MTSHTESFEGQIVAVTGGGSGIGRQYCVDLAAAGASVLVCGRGGNAEAVADDIRKCGGIAQSFVGRVDDGAGLVEAACLHFGRLDAIIVNAGHVRDRTFAKMTSEEWLDVLDVHVQATFAIVSAVWPLFMGQGGGRIVLTTSAAGLYGNFGQSNYTAAKGAIVGLLKTLAQEGARDGILVNAIAPVAGTAMTRGMLDDSAHSLLDPAMVSAFVLAMVHPRCQSTGTIVEAGGGWGAAVRWERSVGIAVAPGAGAWLDVLANWQALTRFDGDAQHPSSIQDSLREALSAANRCPVSNV